MNYRLPFAIFAEASVTYVGRATSILSKGNYLIVRKPDGTVMIHGARTSKPLNYQNSCTSEVEVQELIDSTVLIFKRKSETIAVTIHKTISEIDLSTMSEGNLELKGTERHLVDKILANLPTIIPGITSNSQTIVEAPTTHGNIDILIIDENTTHHVIEVKRNKITLAACGQVKRYGQFFIDQGKNVIEYLIAPEIGDSALKFCSSYNIKYIKYQ